jgi:hypothetical protein
MIGTARSSVFPPVETEEDVMLKIIIVAQLLSAAN